MTSSPDQEFTRLLEGYFDNRLSQKERATLEQKLRSDPAARSAYWEAAQWHAALTMWGEQHAGEEAAKLRRSRGLHLLIGVRGWSECWRQLR